MARQKLHRAQYPEIRLRTRKDKGCGQQVSHGGLAEGAILLEKKDNGIRSAEFKNHLTAGPAGLAGGVVEVGDSDSADANCRPMEGNGSGDGGLLGAGGEAVGAIFDVAAGDRGSVFEKDGSPYAEVAVGRISVLGSRDGLLLKLFDYGTGKVDSRIRRHDCEANGWVSR